MTVATAADIAAGLKQLIQFQKTSVGGTAGWRNPLASAGLPAAGVLSAGNTANGVVPTDATAGYPNIQFGSGRGHITWLEYISNVASCRAFLFDRVFHCGAYAFNAATTLTTQPSYAARVPNTDYTQCQLWYEQVTNGTGTQNLAVTYTDQDGNPGATTGTIAVGSNINSGNCFQLPLAAGDSGVSKIESVTGTTATVGTFNIAVLRPLVLMGCKPGITFVMYNLNMEQMGLPEVYADSALSFFLNNSSSPFTLEFEIVSK